MCLFLYAKVLLFITQFMESNLNLQHMLHMLYTHRVGKKFRLSHQEQTSHVA